MPHLFQRFVIRHFLIPKSVSSRSHPSLQMKSIEGDICVTLAMLRRYINPLESTLYRLPQDLLPEVVSHLASETDLINATHVSRHLRSALLSYPSLWSHLNFENEMRAHAFFERSGKTPLHVDMARNADRMVGSVTELRQQSKRMVTLKLRHWSIQKKFLSELLPSLRRLEVFFEYYYDDVWDEDWDIWNPVWGPMEKATSWSFPSLTSLIVHGLNPIPFYTPHLTCFKFWQELETNNADMLINFLNNCPLLEHIDVAYSEGLQRNRDLVVSLPSLRTYTETTFDGAYPLTVLNALSLPPFCSVTLCFRGDRKPTAATHDILLRFNNPDYLAEIKRVKLRTTHDADGNEVAGSLELINGKGTKVCSERIAIGQGRDWSTTQGVENYPHNVAHLNLLRDLDGRSVEILCIDGCASQDIRWVPVDFLREALCLGNVRILILSHSAVKPCLMAFNGDLGESGNSRWVLPIDTFIIHSSMDDYDSFHEVPGVLLSIARKRKLVGFPLKSVSLFLCHGLEWYWDEVLGQLKSCVEKLEVFTGDDVLDWDIDKHFLDGLERLQRDRGIQWD